MATLDLASIIAQPIADQHAADPALHAAQFRSTTGELPEIGQQAGGVQLVIQPMERDCHGLRAD
jgi:hypothetical protein